MEQACDEVNRLNRAEQFPILAASSSALSFPKLGVQLATNSYTGIGYNYSHQEPIAEFKINGVSGEILAASGKFLDFQIDAAWSAHFHAPTYGTPVPAKWTEAHAIDVASKFADIFTKPWKRCLGKPVARFTCNGIPIEEEHKEWPTTAEEWEVTWKEQSPSGIPYQQGKVSVLLSEKYGPYEAEIDLGLAQYEEENIVPFDQNKALVEARKGLDAIFAQGRADGSLPNARLVQDKPTVSLMVVQPSAWGWMCQPKSLPKSSFLNQSKARLAWVVTYMVTTSDRQINGGLSVYIDAKDGSIMCCDSPELLQHQ